MSLREKLIAEIGEISEHLSQLPKVGNGVDAYLPNNVGKAERFIKLINCILSSVGNKQFCLNNDQKVPDRREWYVAAASVFKNIDIPEGEFLSLSHIVSISLNGDNVEITRNLKLLKKLPPRKEAVVKWVQIDENTRVRENVLDASGHPKMKTLKAEEIVESIPLVYSLPISFFEDLLNEIGQKSLISPPSSDYIPAQLGSNLMEALSSLSLAPELMPLRDFGAKCPGWNAFTGRSASFTGRSALYPTPFRLFLKPEQGTDRQEIIIEPYPEEEIKANYRLIADRKNWSNFDVSSTKTVKTLCDRVAAKYQEMKESKK
jgi:hypothetical protein